MKTQKLVMLDEDLVKKLRQEDNASALINKLLSEYYFAQDLNNLSIPQLEQKLKIVRIEKEAEKKIKEITNATIE